jgi:choline-sulfatase
MDEQIGQVFKALEGTGKSENTYVIFTSDHGLAVGQHGLMGKQNMYDHSTRIPLIIAGPGVPAGKRVDQMVYQHSVFPTTCELAGIAVPKTVEFPSLADALKGRPAEKHDAMFCYYRDLQRAVRTAEHKLIVYPKAGVTQLFDLAKDPWEMHNVADKRECAGVKKRLTARLQRFQRELEDEMQPIA